MERTLDGAKSKADLAYKVVGTFIQHLVLAAPMRAPLLPRLLRALLLGLWLTVVGGCCWIVLHEVGVRHVLGTTGLLMKTRTCVRGVGVVHACGLSLLFSASSHAQTPPTTPTSPTSALPEPSRAPPAPPLAPSSGDAPSLSAPLLPVPPPPPRGTPSPTSVPSNTPVPAGVMPSSASRQQPPSMWGPLFDGRVRREPYWYGQDLGLVLGPVDLVTALMFASQKSQLQIFAWANFGVAHAFMGPIFHWAYGDTARGFGSLAINVMLPLIGGYAGAFTRSDNAFVAILATSFVGAQAIDVFALAHGTQLVSYPLQRKQSSSLRPSSVGVLPWFDGNRSGLSIVGRF